MADQYFSSVNGYKVKDDEARKVLEEITSKGAGKICQLNGEKPLYFWVGTQAEYNKLSETKDDCFYIITDDPTFEDVQNDIKKLDKKIIKKGKKLTK